MSALTSTSFSHQEVLISSYKFQMQKAHRRKYSAGERLAAHAQASTTKGEELMASVKMLSEVTSCALSHVVEKTEEKKQKTYLE